MPPRPSSRSTRHGPAIAPGGRTSGISAAAGRPPPAVLSIVFMTPSDPGAPVVPRRFGPDLDDHGYFRQRCVSITRNVASTHGCLTMRREPSDDQAHMPTVTREELEASLSDLCTHVEEPRAGILGPSSLAWQLGGDLAVFIGGGRAALLQLAHPMVAHAIDHHSKTRTDVVGRFQRTFRNVFAMVFGELDDAVRAARRVHSVHNRITGTFPHAIGSWPAGTVYHANDADALRWVHATLVDTTIVVRERLDGPLPESTKDRYVVELNRFAALFGIPKRLLPMCWADH